MREIKFRAWDGDKMNYYVTIMDGKHWSCYDDCEIKGTILMQYTGLKDKNEHLTEIYECDIIDSSGKIIGNIYQNKELLNEEENVKDSSHLIIQGFGTEDWETTNKKAMERGCTYS